MDDSITLRKFNEDDLPAIAGFRGKFPLSPLVKVETAGYHRWKFLANPAAAGHIWLAEDKAKIVATASMTLKKMKVLDGEILAAETGDTFTLPEYQGKGIFTSLVKNTTGEAVKKGITFIYGLPNANSLPGYTQKLDYGLVQAPELRYLGKPLNIKKILEKKLKSRFMAGIFSFPLQVAFKLIFRLAAMRVGGSGISVSEVSAFPEDIDSLWQQVSPRYDILVVRDKKYLDWRYVASPNSYLKLVARDKEGVISGYMVTRISRIDDRTEGFMADFFTREDNAGVFKRLVAASVEICQKNQVDIISAWAMKGSFYYNTLVRLGFLPWTRIPLICYRNESGNRILNKAFKWHFTQGDCDGI